MNNEQTLLQGVIDRPNDALAKNVYADYLEEHGHTTLAHAYRWAAKFKRHPKTYRTAMEKEYCQWGDEYEDASSTLSPQGQVEAPHALFICFFKSYYEDMPKNPAEEPDEHERTGSWPIAPTHFTSMAHAFESLAEALMRYPTLYLSITLK